MKKVNKFLTSGAVITTLGLTGVSVQSALADEVQPNEVVNNAIPAEPSNNGANTDNNVAPAQPDESEIPTAEEQPS
ncbi:hypothetical protein ACHM05_00475, partial [Staphylococcus aureus]|uniref:hypothetical protein n=1 Tax=Staphylococcus aureus TaxID=1280 RepID=UPI0037548ED1